MENYLNCALPGAGAHTRLPPTQEPIQQFRNALQARNIIPPERILADGELHRCDVKGKKGRNDAAYVLHLDGVAAGGFQNHRDGLGWESWKADIGRSLSPAEVEAQRKHVDAARRQREKAEEHYREHAAADARDLWQRAKPSPAEHPYLVSKKVKAYGVRVEGCDLVIPASDANGKITTVQRIDAKGKKRFLPYGRKQASYYGIAKPDGIVCVVEGFATGASVHEATGYAVAVAFDTGNLLPVAKALRARHPEVQIILAADDDFGTEGNPGLTKAQEAASAVGGCVAMPLFTGERMPGQTDFNDLHQAQGLDAVRQCFETVMRLGNEAVTDEANDGALDDEGVDPHRNAPRPDTAALYGLVGDIARTAAETTEANPYAVALHFMTYMSAAVGRVAFLPVGNTWHHPRLFAIQVGRTGRGRKGDAVSIVHRIDEAIRAKVEHIAPKVHRGGLSTREGLAYLIHDGYKDGKTEVAPVHDKRLWVVESEFANVMSQTKREGNTLSAALRDCWDGVSIRPATKSSRIWASDPHVAISAAVTPGELRSMLATRELTNGFANRFLMVYAERERLVPFPQATAQDKIDDFAGRIIEVLRAVGAHRPVETDMRRISLTPAAQTLYGDLYRGELNDQSGGELVNALIERRAPMLLRLAMLFTICDMRSEIDVPHVQAAHAWVRLSIDSIKYVFATDLDEAATAEISKAADKILQFLKVKGCATRKAITTECFSGHLAKDQIDAALDELLAATPPRIEVETVPTAGRARKIYCLASANDANYAKEQQRRGAPPDLHVSEQGEGCEGSERAKPGTDDLVRIVRMDANEQKGAEVRAGAATSLSSLPSREDVGVGVGVGDEGPNEGDDIEEI